MEKKLISMVDFVLEQQKEFIKVPIEPINKKVRFIGKSLTLIHHYANFLKQRLTLGFFVPCDLGENVLYEPEDFWQFEKGEYIEHENNKRWIGECKQFQQAKERVLFEGFKIDSAFDKSVVTDGIMINMLEYITFQKVESLGITYGSLKTVEDLVQFELDLTLTACKQIGIN